MILQLLFTYTTPFEATFGTEAIPLRIWPRMFAGGLVFFLVVETEKFVIVKGHHGGGSWYIARRKYAAGMWSIDFLTEEGADPAGLSSATDEMRCAAPGVMRKRFEASDGVDASNRLVYTHHSSRYRA